MGRQAKTKLAYVETLQSGRVRVRVWARDESGKLGLRRPQGIDTFDTLEEANEWARAAGSLLRHQRRASKGEGTSVRDVALALIFEKRGTKSAERMQSLYDNHITSDVIADIDVNDVTTLDIDKFRQRLKAKAVTRVGRAKVDGAWVFERRELDRTLSAQTRKNVMTFLRVVFRFAKTRGHLVHGTPFKDLLVERERTTSNKRGVALSLDQLRALMDAVPGPEKWLIGFAAAQGLRAGEIVSLHWDDVHLDVDAPYIIVRFGGTPLRTEDGEMVWPPTKGGKPRHIPLLPMAIECLQGWRRDTEGWWQGEGAWGAMGLVFPGRRGGVRQPLHLLRHDVWQKVKEAAGVRPDTRFHDLRHTCATSLLHGWWGEKWELKNVQHFLGHAEASTTQRYLHEDLEGMERAATRTLGFGSAGRQRRGNDAPRFGAMTQRSSFHELSTRRSLSAANYLKSLAPPGGVEPPARGLGTFCETQSFQEVRPPSEGRSFPRTFHGLAEQAQRLLEEAKARRPTASSTARLLVTMAKRAAGDRTLDEGMREDLQAAVDAVEKADASFRLMASVDLAEVSLNVVAAMMMGDEMDEVAS